MGWRKFCLTGSFLFCVSAHTHPVAYKDSLGLMLWSNSESIEALSYYSLSSKLSLGVNAMLKPMEDGRFREVALHPRVGWLVKRWNLSDSQANIYLTGGAGARRMDNIWRGSTLLEAESDWENRSYYVSGKFKALDVGQSFFEESYTLRAGLAPYLGEMDRLNTWFILQMDYDPKNLSRWVATPLMRLYYENILLEIGYSTRGMVQLNLMTHL